MLGRKGRASLVSIPTRPWRSVEVVGAESGEFIEMKAGLGRGQDEDPVPVLDGLSEVSEICGGEEASLVTDDGGQLDLTAMGEGRPSARAIGTVGRGSGTPW